MSRIIDPREQHARRGQPRAVAEPPDLSVAQVFTAERRRERERRHVAPYQPRPKGLVVPDGAVPVVARSSRGVLHRGYRLDGKVTTHPRCHVAPVEILPAGAESWFENLRRPGLMCRYPWCFRDLLEDMGVDTYVGHVSRRVRRWVPSEPREVVA